MRVRIGFLLAVALAAIAVVAATGAFARPDVLVRRDLHYGTASAQVLDVYLPVRRAAAPRPAVVFVHGGGWREGDKVHYRSAATRLARAGWVAFSIDYRLWPAARFPAALDDTVAAVRWIRARARRFGIDPRRLAAFGGSAGANLAALLATRGLVRAAVAWSPPTDLARPGAGVAPLVRGYLGCGPASCPARYRAASPALLVGTATAPIFVANSTHELVPLGQARALARALATARVPYELFVLRGRLHADAYAKTAWTPSLAFLERYLGALPART